MNEVLTSCQLAYQFTLGLANKGPSKIEVV